MGIWGLHVLGVYEGVGGFVTQVVCENGTKGGELALSSQAGEPERET